MFLTEVFDTPEVSIIGIFVLPEYGYELELVTSDISFNSVSPWKNLNLYSNSFGWQLFPINFHLKLHKEVNNANFGTFEKVDWIKLFGMIIYLELWCKMSSQKNIP